ncbi:MAG TPA: hypothetical protein VMP67_06980, partial [Candidatus Limnocylindria bacterium]|nr:hypothetical protein [Candidatus Limnocylindria bacterium]
PCWGWKVVAVLYSEPPSSIPPDIATPVASTPQVEPSPVPPADVIECRDIVRLPAGRSPTTPSGMSVTDHAGIVTGCRSLGAGGDPPYQTGVEVTSTNPTSTNLDVVWPVPERCDYDPTSLSLWPTREGYLLQVDRLDSGDAPQPCLAAFGQRKVQLALAAPIDVATIDAFLLVDGVAVDPVEFDGSGIGFSLTLASDGTDYFSGDVIGAQASLGYEGRPGETVTLVGSGSGLVTFSVQQLDGDLSMGSPRTGDCRSYQMTAGEPHVYAYRKGAGWSADDPNANFYRSWVEEPDFTLPSGTWRIEAYTEFYVGDCAGPLHEMKASIVVTVR